MRRLVFPLFALVLLAGSARLWGDELASWYRSDPRSSGYVSVRDDLRQIFSEGSREHVPLWVLAEKLREGASKRVSPERLVSCVRAELGRLERARWIVEQAAPRSRGVDARTREGSMKAVVIFLRGGLPEPLIGELFAASAGTPGGEESALSACEALIELRTMARIPDSDSLTIGRLLISSPMRPAGYGSLAPVFARARTRGLSDEHVVKEVVIPTLSSGGDAAAMMARIESAQPPHPSPASAALPVSAGHPSMGSAPSAGGANRPGAAAFNGAPSNGVPAYAAPGHSAPARPTPAYATPGHRAPAAQGAPSSPPIPAKVSPGHPTSPPGFARPQGAGPKPGGGRPRAEVTSPVN